MDRGHKRFGRILEWLRDANRARGVAKVSPTAMRVLIEALYSCGPQDHTADGIDELSETLGLHPNRTKDALAELSGRGFAHLNSQGGITIPLLSAPDSGEKLHLIPVKRQRKTSPKVGEHSHLIPVKTSPDSGVESHLIQVKIAPNSGAENGLPHIGNASARPEETTETTEKAETPRALGGMKSADAQMPIPGAEAPAPKPAPPKKPTAAERKAAKQSAADADLATLFTAWQTAVQQPGWTMTPRREKDLRLLITECGGLERAILCVKGMALSSHHMGKNDDEKLYNEPKYCRRDTNRENWIAAASKQLIAAGKPKVFDYATQTGNDLDGVPWETRRRPPFNPRTVGQGGPTVTERGGLDISDLPDGDYTMTDEQVHHHRKRRQQDLAYFDKIRAEREAAGEDLPTGWLGTAPVHKDNPTGPENIRDVLARRFRTMPGGAT